MPGFTMPFSPAEPGIRIAPRVHSRRNLPPVYEIERADGVASEKAVLVRVILDGQTAEGDPLDEITGLAKTAGARVVSGLIQRRDVPDVTAYLGKGKVEELKSLVAHHDADVVIFD